MTKISVNMLSKNMFEINIDRMRLLQSYSTIVAAYINEIYYVTEIKYSVTTSRHIKGWLDMTMLPSSIIEYKPQSFFDNLTII